ncbi:MAG: Maf family nucleotide pyrophosphatase, partial [Gammaproteobacteria bacterium]|nr:Maf family nucleotide pyrophosphatase [Gammaproteobacteria bacterium]
MATPRLILASTSPYRRALLERLGLSFECRAPAVQECRHRGEAPRAMVERLAQAKARDVAVDTEGALVIGSDQCAVVDGEPVGKPGGRQANIRQLETMAGRWVEFLTAVCVLNSATGRAQIDTVGFAVRLRRLDEAEIISYVDREQPFDCAGGFKSEGLGIALFDSMRGDDPTALIGLPLIRLRQMLEDEG